MARCLVLVSLNGSSTPRDLRLMRFSRMWITASRAIKAGMERSKGVVPVSTSAEKTSPGRSPMNNGILHRWMVLPVLEPSAKWKSLVRSVLSHWYPSGSVLEYAILQAFECIQLVQAVSTKAIRPSPPPLLSSNSWCVFATISKVDPSWSACNSSQGSCSVEFSSAVM